MKQIIKIFFLFFLVLFAQKNYAQTANVCQPYSIPIGAPIACGDGYVGYKFAMKTKTCPDGRITEGQSFNTDGCRRISDIKDPNALNCNITPNAVGCVSPPSMKGCGAGKHWTTQGSGISHCVQDDYNCPWGQQLKHDSLGNPSCQPIICPSNQVLQGNGVCGCSAGMGWNGASCAPLCTDTTQQETASCTGGQTGTMTRDVLVKCDGQRIPSAWNTSTCITKPVSCPPAINQTRSCPTGYSGTYTFTTNYSGPLCTPSSTDDSASQCHVIPPPPITCPNPTVTSFACGSGYTGTVINTVSYTPSQNGQTCIANTLEDRTQCKVMCTPSFITTQETAACEPGWTGIQKRDVTTNTCTSEVKYGVWNKTTCTKDPEPSPITYQDEDRWFRAAAGKACSLQKWRFGYQNGVKVSSELLSTTNGYIGALGMCVLEHDVGDPP